MCFATRFFGLVKACGNVELACVRCVGCIPGGKCGASAGPGSWQKSSARNGWPRGPSRSRSDSATSLPSLGRPAWRIPWRLRMTSTPSRARSSAGSAWWTTPSAFSGWGVPISCRRACRSHCRFEDAGLRHRVHGFSRSMVTWSAWSSSHSGKNIKSPIGENTVRTMPTMRLPLRENIPARVPLSIHAKDSRLGHPPPVEPPEQLGERALGCSRKAIIVLQ
jgi:hypothetical protein